MSTALILLTFGFIFGGLIWRTRALRLEHKLPQSLERDVLWLASFMLMWTVLGSSLALSGFFGQPGVQAIHPLAWVGLPAWIGGLALVLRMPSLRSYVALVFWQSQDWVLALHAARLLAWLAVFVELGVSWFQLFLYVGLCFDLIAIGLLGVLRFSTKKLPNALTRASHCLLVLGAMLIVPQAFSLHARPMIPFAFETGLHYPLILICLCLLPLSGLISLAGVFEEQAWHVKSDDTPELEQSKGDQKRDILDLKSN